VSPFNCIFTESGGNQEWSAKFQKKRNQVGDWTITAVKILNRNLEPERLSNVEVYIENGASTLCGTLPDPATSGWHVIKCLNPGIENATKVRIIQRANTNLTFCGIKV